MGRRLSAIFAADMVGYSRLMEADETGTLNRQKAHRQELINPAVAEFHGRIVKEIGDGILVEFPSVVEAVQCAVKIQRTMPQREADLPQDRQIVYRIGINMGDIVVESNDIYGDGVNVAARLEALAEPGGICISGMAYDQIDGRDEFDCVFLGEQTLKNISRPIRIYRVVVSERGTKEASVQLKPALPDKASIAVLPFNNLSGDPDQEYFSDGMTEDLITALSKIRWLFVIARNSSFAYRGSSSDVRRVAAELGVRYILEGSVRKSGNRIRVTAQLIDASNGVHVWAERFDREIGDIFSLQDEITGTLIGSIEPELAKAEQQRAIAKPVESLDAWSWFQRGLWHHYRATKEDNQEASRYINKAIELDPNFSRALAALAHVHYWNVLFGYSDNPRQNLDAGLSLAKRAITADDMEPFAHFALGRIYTLLGELDNAIAELEQAIELSPSFAHAYYGLGNALNFAGRAEEAITMIDRAIRLNPHDPALWTFISGRAWSLIFLGRFEEAHDWAIRGARQANAGWISHAILASTFAELGQAEKANEAMQDTLRIKPDFRISFVVANYPFEKKKYLDNFVGALRKAGFEE